MVHHLEGIHLSCTCQYNDNLRTTLLAYIARHVSFSFYVIFIYHFTSLRMHQKLLLVGNLQLLYFEMSVFHQPN